MDYPYYTAPTPFQYLGFASDPNQTQQTSQPNGFGGTTSIPQFDSVFESFDQNAYERNSIVPARVQPSRQSLQSVQQTPASSISPSDSHGNDRHQSELSDSNIKSNKGMVVPNLDTFGQSGMDIDPIGEELINRARSSSEERDSMTPAQSKRKAQNRAAQRAFRERKERHVKELEAKIHDLAQASTSLRDENERLTRELAKVATENEILRATSSSIQSNQKARGSQATSRREEEERIKMGPMEYTPSNFLTALHVNHSDLHDSAYVALDPPIPADPSSSSSTDSTIIKHLLPGPLITPAGSFLPSAHKITVSPLSGQRLLAAGATWDYIQAHPLFQEGLVDITDVLESLKGTAECNGTGPAFEERKVLQAIEESVAKA